MDPGENNNISNENKDNKEEKNIKEEEENNNKEENIIKEEKNNPEEKNNTENNNNININVNLNNIINFSDKDEKKNENVNEEENANDNLININKELENKNNNDKNEIQKLLNLETFDENRKKLMIKNSDKLKNIPIFIHSAKTIEINNVPVLIYFIRGKLVYKEILRTFSDFELFYQSLLDMWPCICVPGLAFRQSTPSTNTAVRFPEIKTKLLNHFFKKLAESNQLLNCEVTQIFLSQDKNFSMKLTSMKIENYKEISERYINSFADFVEDKKKTDEKELFIKRFMKLLEITYKKLVDVGKTIENEIYNIKKEQSSLDFVTNMFLDLEKSLPNQSNYLTDIKNISKPLKSVSINIKII